MQQLHKAMFYTKEGEYIYCKLCPQGCRLKEGMRGLCEVRQVKGGKLYSLNYGVCASVAMDPIEKKPLYHFYPGWDILSLGTWGCNFHCSFCQNWSLARGGAGQKKGYHLKPIDVLHFLRDKYKSSAGIAYTYNEPTVWYEFVYDTAKLVKESGYRNILVTNGFISPEALEEISPFIDALNIDVKSFNDDFYRKYCRGNLESVKRTVEYCAERFHVEITCLVIPTLNDSPGETDSLTDWLAGLNPDIPLHFSRFFPQYKLALPPTPVETLTEIRRKAMDKMNYVYIGNVAGHEEVTNTYCPRCQNLLIERGGYRALNRGINAEKCTRCSNDISLDGDFPS